MNDRQNLKIWLSYVSYPATTAAYIERALRRKYNVITVGPQLPEELIKSWNLKGMEDIIKPHNISTGFEPDLLEIKEQIDKEYHPDIYLWVESVFGYYPKNIDKLGCPTACYLIDSHMNLKLHLQLANDFDYVFIAQREYLEKFKEHCHENIYWLPLGADPEIHSPKSKEKFFDVGFVGSLSSSVHERRKNLLEKINLKNKVAFKRCFLDEMSKHFSQSKIVFNNAIKNDLNMRVFEAMSIGSLLLTDKTEGNGQTVMFADGEDYVLYDDDNINEKINYYLTHEDEREKIAARGREIILKAHTYFHRVEELLDVVTGNKTDTKTPDEWRELSLRAEPDNNENTKIANPGYSRPERSFIIPVIDFSPFSEYNIKTLLNDLDNIEGEVIVVFNSMEVYEQLKDHPRIDQFAAIKQNVGVSRAWNIGLNIARSKTSFILNSDLHIEPEAVYTLEEALDKLPMAAIVGPQGSYLHFEKMEIIQYFEKGEFNQPVKVDEVSGFLLVVKTELFNSSVISFDNAYTPCYSEEWDIALQCKMAGLNLYAVPTTGYSHEWGGSIGTLDRTIEYYGQTECAKDILVRNREKFLRKWKSMASFAESRNILVSVWADIQLEKAKSIAAENKADAIKIMDMVIEQFPDYIPALEFMAKLYVDDDNLAESLKYLSHIENLDPDYKINVENLSTKGIVKQLVI